MRIRLLVLACLAVWTIPARSQPASGDKWTGTWSSAVQEVERALQPPSPPGFADTTIRQIVRVSIGGSRLRVRFSNAFGPPGSALSMDSAEVAIPAGGGAIMPGTGRPLTFHGERSASIPQGALMISDPVDFKLAPGSDLAVTIHVREASDRISGHRSARAKTTFIQAGNSVSSVSLPHAVPINVWYFLSGVDVQTRSYAGAIVCLGDSITDGRGSTEGENRRWPDFLARRLLSNRGTAPIGVLNEGIGGNCVWRGGIGQPAIARMDRDVLSQPNARWLIVFEGINDLGGGRTTAGELIAGLDQIVLQAKARGLIVYGATLPPCGGSSYFSPDLESKRAKVNAWIKTGGAFDAVIDLDALLRDPNDASRLLREVDSGDHLHLGDKGYQTVGDSIDLAWFAP